MSCCEVKANGTPPAGPLHGIINVGGFAEVYRNGTGPGVYEQRTLQSSDASVGILQNALDVDFTVLSGAVAADVFQTDSTATRSSNSTTPTVMATMAGTSKMLEGEQWKVNMCVLVCYPTTGPTANAQQFWEIETSAGVFTEIDKYSIKTPLAISGAEKSQPFHRTIKITAGMDAPRMRLLVHRTSAGSTAFFWELPRWGGAQIEEAP